MFALRLPVKINIALLLAMVGITVVFISFIYPLESRRASDQIERVRVLLDTIYKQKQDEFANAIFSDQHLSMVVALQEIQEIVDEIDNACLYDVNGDLLYCAKRLQPVPEQFMPLPEDGEQRFAQIPLEQGAFCAYLNSIKVIGEEVGYLAIYYDLSRIKGEIASIILLSCILFISGLLVVTLLLNVFLSQAIINPLNVLRSAMGRVTGGKLGETVLLDTRDEIGDIGATFNEMSRTLLQNREEILKHHLHLEDLVRERTQALQRAKEQAERAEEKQRGQWEILRIIMETIPNPLFYKDTHGRYTGCNVAFEEFVGIARDNLIGRTVFDIIDHDHAERTTAEDRKLLEQPGTLTSEWRVKRADGDLREVKFSKATITDEHGAVVGLVGVMSDVTDLVRAREQAELASSAKSQFLANMSHEIRTPMNGVIGMTTLLSDTELDSRQRDCVETIKSSAESLLRIINDILDYSRIEAGKLLLRRQEFNLRELLDECLDVLKVKAREKQLEFICDCHPEVPVMVSGDRGRLKQILINLAGNAIKFTDSGEIVIYADKPMHAGSDVVLSFSVSDTGIGIAQEQGAHLFESFTQVDGSYTRKFGGTGLGLAISKELVELLGGKISLESIEGDGSIFTFTVRMRKVVWPQDITPAAMLADKRIAVGAASDRGRKMLCSQLEQLGCIVQTVSDPTVLGELLSCEGQPPDVVVLDTGLFHAPLDAESFVDEYQKIFPDLKWLVLQSDDSGVKRQNVSGIVCLQKPIRMSDLRNSVLLLACGEEVRDGELSGDMGQVVLQVEQGNLSILLVEDNPINMRVATGILGKIGFHSVSTAENGNQALEYLASHSCDLVLMDLSMPELDGFETTRCIRAGKGGVLNPAVPIIALTAHAMQGDRERCIEAGMNAYLSKPLEPEDLRRIMQQILPATLLSNSQLNEHERNTGENSKDMSDVLDFEAMVGRLLGDRDTAALILVEVQKELPKLLEELEQAVSSGETDTIARQAHKLKGAASSISANRLRTLFMALETAGENADAANMAELMTEIRGSISELSKAIDGVLA